MVHSAINKLLFWQQALEYELSITKVKTMEVLSLDLIFSCDGNSVEVSQLRDVEENLETVELAVLDGVAAQINIG